MRKRKISIILISTLLLTIFSLFALEAQPEYWTALNYDIYVNNDGTVLVTAKFHPFTVTGESLYKNSTVEKELKEGEQTMITEILLMFSKKPEKLKYKIISHLHSDDRYSVLCDIRNTGKMDKMQGAYVLQILIYLNSSDFISHIKNNIYKVKIRDSYTSQNPNSWIDVLNVTFSKDIKIEKVEWEPDFAHGPTNKTKNSFLWINFNQPEAPDFYVFEIELKNFKIVTLTNITGKIIDAFLNKNYVYVKVHNNSSYNGYLYVRIVTDYLNQTRKIYVGAEKSATVPIPLPVNSSTIIIELWSDSKKVDTKIFKLREKELSSPLGLSYKDVSLYLAIAGAIIVIISLFLKEKEKREYNIQEYGYYSYPYH